jgi:hypothetical protein
MRKLQLVVGHVQKQHEKPTFTLAAMAGNKTLREWNFASEKERSDFLLNRNTNPGAIQFSDDDLEALGIDPKTLG